MRKAAAAALLPFLLQDGNLGPKYNRPVTQPPANYYSQEQAKQNSFADEAWWDLFKDPVLQGLMREALQNNYDLPPWRNGIRQKSRSKRRLRKRSAKCLLRFPHISSWGSPIASN
jgi:outer membrane protein TolC